MGTFIECGTTVFVSKIKEIDCKSVYIYPWLEITFFINGLDIVEQGSPSSAKVYGSRQRLVGAVTRVAQT